MGADNYIGGGGTDKLWLDGHAAGMAISIDGQPNDGSSGEGDNVGSDIEEIVGTVHNDVFTGSAGPDNFEGGGGNDDIHGAGGNDDLYGGSNDDRVFGDAGNDKVQGASGADSVDGGAGTTRSTGTSPPALCSAHFDSDTMSARDGERDTVDCGGGADSAVVDQLDVVAFCASVPSGRGRREGQLRRLEEDGEGEPQGPLQLQLQGGAGLRGKAVFGSWPRSRSGRPAAAGSS